MNCRGVVESFETICLSIGCDMLVYDDIYPWEGWGGALRLGRGKCRLRIFDLRKETGKAIFLRPFIVVVTDVPESKTSIRNFSAHIATSVTREFKLDPRRVLWVEYYPAVIYGAEGDKMIPERYDAVEFTWQKDRALHPVWRTLQVSLRDLVKTLLEK